MSEKLKTRDSFKSKSGFIISCIGSAVGMGNIWRFPILVSKYGGGTFLIPYFIFIILIGSTGVIEEFSLGRWASSGPVGAFGKATESRFKNRRLGELIGSIPVIGSMMLAIGYSIVLSWIFKYCFMGISGGLFSLGTDMNTIIGEFASTAPESESLSEAVSTMFSNGLFGIGNGLWLVIAMVVSLAIMAFGIAGGIEKANKVMMPVLFGLFLCLAFYIAALPGAGNGYGMIFKINPEGLENPELWLFAFGQAFFSLSVAGNGSVIYGSYLGKNEDIPSAARNVVIFDTIAALLATFVIIPAMTSSGADISEGGPGLLFIYMVNVFNGMPGGRFVGMIFYICVLFAGLSSIVNLYEAPIAFLQDRIKLKRLLSVVIVGLIGGFTALIVQPRVSWWMDVVSIYICPFGALLAGVIFFWILKKKTALDAVNEGGKKTIGKWFYPLGKFVYCAMALAALVFGAIYGSIG